MNFLKSFILFLFCLTTFQEVEANSITFTPNSQSVTTNSGEEIEVTIILNCYGNANGFSNYFIYPISLPDNGFQGIDFSTGNMLVGDVHTRKFNFDLSVAATTTSTYEFRADWYDENGNFNQTDLSITVTYVNDNPDSDGDGVPDSEDDCPNDPGPASNNGCPITCDLAAPSGRTTSNITTTSAKISWNAVTNNDGYQAQRKQGSSSWTTVYAGNALEYSLNNLQPETTYNWRVRTQCDNGDYGNWSSSTSFTTLEEVCELPAPSNLSTTDIYFNMATVSWSPVTGSNGYSSEYKLASSLNWNTINNGSSDTFHTISLQPETAYNWRVRTICPNGIYSNWSAIVAFSTPAECIENISINNTIQSGQIEFVEVSNTITSYSDLENGSSTTYSAGNKILLKPIQLNDIPLGFHAKPGSYFRAYIEGCSNGPNKMIIEEKEAKPSEIVEPKIETELKLFPNPTTGSINIISNQKINHWELNNFYGKQLKQGYNNSKALNMTIRDYPSGIYILRLHLESGEIITKQIIKK